MALTLRQSLVLYGLFMVLAVAGVTYFVQTAPPLPEAQCANIVTPMDVVRGKLVKEPQTSILNLWNCLREYKKDNWWHTTAGIWGIYVIFKIFGPFGAGTSMVLSVLIGALYDEWAEPMTRYSFLAHFLGLSGEVCGGAGGWIMSYCIGREILLHFAAEKMATLKKEMDKFQGSMFRYMLFLRVSPLFPNWFVNYSTAMIGMPFWYFLVASTLAIQPGDIQAHVKVFKLAGRVGQVLSHSAELFLYGDDAGTFEAILRLQPLIHVTREAHFQVAREGPLGAIHEVWSEVAMVELPRLFQLSITHATSAVGIPKQQFLVEEEDEILVINAWQRDEDEISKSLTAISLEQLLWCETLRALAETPPCAEEAVPAARLSLADEGVTTYEELLDSPNEEGAGVPREDAPRLASLAFLRQYVNRPVLEEELLPRLLPNQSGVVRVFSAQLDEHEGTSPLKGLRPPKPKTLDDLFSENPDFRKPSHYATGIDENDPDRGDPLIPYDLTSVLLLCETSGFLLAFHCLQAKDPST